MSHFDASGQINLDLTAFVRGLNQARGPSQAFVAAIGQMHRALLSIDPLEKKRADALRTTLPLYKQLSSSVNAYVITLEKLSKLSQQSQSSTRVFSEAMAVLRRTMSELRPLTDKQAAGLQNTITIYRQLAQTVNSYVSALQAMQRLTGQNTTEQQRAATAARADAQAKREQAAATRQLEAEQRRAAAAAQAQARAQQQLAQAFSSAQQDVYRKAARAMEEVARSSARAQQRVSQETSRALIRDAETAARGQVEAAHRAAQGILRAVQGSSTAQIREAQRAARETVATAQRAAQERIRIAQQLAAREEQAARQAARAANMATDAMSNQANTLFSLRSALGEMEQIYRRLAEAMFALSQAAVSTAISFEASFAHVGRVTQETDGQLADMRDRFQELSREIPATFEEISQVAVRAAQVGIAREEMEKFTRTVVMFARTTEVADEQVTLLLGRIMQMGRVPMGRVEHMGAAISELGSSSAATDYELLKMTESIASVVTQTGLSTESLLGMAGALAGLGIRAELGRGALTRVFNVVTRSVGETSERTQALARHMDMTQTAMMQLMAQNPDQFYMRWFESLSNANDAGENLNTVLRQMGIINSRDINVVTRLAANYDLLTEQMTLANDAYARGDFLRVESGRIFDTVQAKIVKFTNAWRNFLDRVGRPLLPVVGAVVDFLGDMADALQALPGFGVVAPIVAGLTALAGAFLAARVAMVAVMAGSIAYNQILAQMPGRAVTLRGAVDLLSGSQSRLAASTSGATAAMTAQAAAAGRSTAAMGAAAGAQAGMGAAAGATMGVLGRTAAFMLGPWGLAIGAAVTGAALLITHLHRMKSSADEAREAGREAAGGIAAFTEAVRADTKAGAENTEVYRRYRSSKQDIIQADRDAAAAAISETEARIRLITSMYGTREQLEYQTKLQGRAAEAARAHLDELDRLEKTIDRTNAAMLAQVSILGDQAGAYVKAEFEATLLASGLYDVETALDTAEDAGISFGNLMETFLRDPAQAAKDFETAISGVDQEIRQLQVAIRETDVDTLIPVYSKEERTAMMQRIEDLRVIRVGLVATRDNTKELDESILENTRHIENARRSLKDSATAMDLYADETAEATGATDEFNDGLADNQELMRGMAQSLSALGGATSAWGDLVRQSNDQAKNSWYEQKQQVDEFFGSSTKAFAAWRKELRKNAEAQANFATNISTIAGVLGIEVAQHLSSLGEEGAAMAQMLVENMGEAGSESMIKLRNEIMATSPAAQEALSSVMEGLAIISDSQGAAVGQTFTAALGREVDKELASGGNADVMRVYEEFQKLNDMIAANPVIAEVIVDTLGAEASLADMMRIAKEMTQQNSVGVEGSAELDTQEYYASAERVQAYKADMESRGLIDPEGRMRLAEDEFLNRTQGVQRTVTEDTLRGKYDPIATPRVDRKQFDAGLERARRDADKAGKQIEDGLWTRPSIDLTRFGTQRWNMLNQARTTGDQVQAALTRQASITLTTHIRPGARPGDQRALADGGWVTGTGGPRQDNIPVWASAGEFMVNAKAARQFGWLLEEINAVGQRSGSSAGALTPALATLSPRAATRAMQKVPPTWAQRASTSVTVPQGERIKLDVTNYYPQAEPTSRTVNRALANVALLDGVS